MPSDADPGATLTRLLGTDTATLDLTGLTTMARTIAHIRSCLDALDTQITGHIARLHQHGTAPAPAEVLQTAGRLSGREARKIVQRAATVAAIPALGDGLAAG